MKYIRLNASNVVMEIILGEDPVFPGIPIEQRYHADFIAALIQTADETEVEQNWIYNPDDQTFSAPPPPEPPPEPESVTTEEYTAAYYEGRDGAYNEVIA